MKEAEAIKTLQTQALLFTNHLLMVSNVMMTHPFNKYSLCFYYVSVNCWDGLWGGSSQLITHWVTVWIPQSRLPRLVMGVEYSSSFRTKGLIWVPTILFWSCDLKQVALFLWTKALVENRNDNNNNKEPEGLRLFLKPFFLLCPPTLLNSPGGWGETQIPSLPAAPPKMFTGGSVQRDWLSAGRYLSKGLISGNLSMLAAQVRCYSVAMPALIRDRGFNGGS